MKKRSPKKITYKNLEKYTFKYLEKYAATEFQLRNILKRKIIKTSFFFQTKPEDYIHFIEDILTKFKKIGLINLKQKGIVDRIANQGINNLKKFFFNFELASGLIYAKKKKIVSFNKKKDFEESKKSLIQMSRAGFTYDIAKKIINLNNEREFLELEKYANDGDV